MFELNHICIVAKNHKKLVQFYIDALGFIIERNVRNKSIELLQSIGLNDSCIEGAHLRLGGSNISLEVISFAGNNASIHYKRPNDLGIGHICFKVKDIEIHLRRLLDKDAQFLGKPITITQDGSNKLLKMCYLKDPEGNILELREELT